MGDFFDIMKKKLNKKQTRISTLPVGELMVDYDRLYRQTLTRVKSQGVTDKFLLTTKVNQTIMTKLENFLIYNPDCFINLYYKNKEPHQGARFYCKVIQKREK